MIFKKISNTFGIFVLVFSIFFMGLFRGVDLASRPPSWISGASVSNGLLISYIWIGILLIIYLLAKTLKRRAVSDVLSILVLILTFIPFRYILLQKSVFFNEDLQISRIYLDFWPLDLISVAFVVGLLSIEGLLAVHHLRDWRRESVGGSGLLG